MIFLFFHGKSYFFKSDRLEVDYALKNLNLAFILE